MEELTQKIEELIVTINANTVSKSLTIAGIIIPILISFVVAGFAIFQHFQTMRLQRIISNRDYKVQMHTDILRIYDDLCLAQNKLGGPNKGIHIIFSGAFTLNNGNDLATYYINDLDAALHLLCQSANRANLLFPKNDIKIRDIINTIYEKSREFKNKVYDYYYKGISSSVVDSAWNKIANSFGIAKGNYGALNNNRAANDTFLEYCKTTTTKEMDDNLKELLELFKYDNFDVYFEKYLQMNLMGGNDNA